MKIATLVLMFILTPALADDDFVGPPAPAPETTPLRHWPHTAHWQLTMIRPDEFVEITAAGFQFISRASCVRDGARRIVDGEVNTPSFIPATERWIGFVCDYVTEGN